MAKKAEINKRRIRAIRKRKTQRRKAPWEHIKNHFEDMKPEIKAEPDNTILCIHCGKVVTLGSLCMDSAGLLECSTPGCDGSMFDFWEDTPGGREYLGIESEGEEDEN